MGDVAVLQVHPTQTIQLRRLATLLLAGHGVYVLVGAVLLMASGQMIY